MYVVRIDRDLEALLVLCLLFAQCWTMAREAVNMLLFLTVLQLGMAGKDLAEDAEQVWGLRGFSLL